jgi:transcription elongation factor
VLVSASLGISSERAGSSSTSSKVRPTGENFGDSVMIPSRLEAAGIAAGDGGISSHLTGYRLPAYPGSLTSSLRIRASVRWLESNDLWEEPAASVRDITGFDLF